MPFIRFAKSFTNGFLKSAIINLAGVHLHQKTEPLHFVGLECFRAWMLSSSPLLDV